MTRTFAEVIVYGSNCLGIPYEERPISGFPRRLGRVKTMLQIVIDDELLGRAPAASRAEALEIAAALTGDPHTAEL